MIKTVITQLYIAFCLICFFACEKQKEEFPDIRIGKEGVVDELSLLFICRQKHVYSQNVCGISR